VAFSQISRRPPPSQRGLPPAPPPYFLEPFFVLKVAFGVRFLQFLITNLLGGISPLRFFCLFVSEFCLSFAWRHDWEQIIEPIRFSLLQSRGPLSLSHLPPFFSLPVFFSPPPPQTMSPSVLIYQVHTPCFPFFLLLRPPLFPPFFDFL